MRVIRAFGQENERLNISSTQTNLCSYQMKTGYWSSHLTSPLTYLIVNGTAGDYLEWFFHSREAGSVRSLDCWSTILQILVGLIKLAMLINSLNQSYISGLVEEVFSEQPEDILLAEIEKRGLLNRSYESRTPGFTYPDAAQPSLGIFLLIWQENSWDHPEELVLVSQPWYRFYLVLYKPDKGTVGSIQAGHSSRDLAQWRSWVAYVPQKNWTF